MEPETEPKDFSDKIGYTFKNSSMQEQALTRVGFAKEKRDRHEECPDQSEFTTLGDAVLKMALIQILREEGTINPGEITIKKSHLENETRLAQIALNLNIWPDIRKDKGEENRGIESQPSLMAETLEAVIGAIFLDSNLDTVKNVIGHWFKDDVEFSNAIECLPTLLKELQDSQTKARLDDFPDSGVYVFYENDQPIYVGRSNSMKSRILKHSRPSSSHFSATFAFNIALKEAEMSDLNIDRTREELLKDAQFNPLFLKAIERVSKMSVRAIEIDDQVTQTLFETYAILALKTTDYNYFHTH